MIRVSQCASERGVGTDLSSTKPNALFTDFDRGIEVFVGVAVFSHFISHARFMTESTNTPQCQRSHLPPLPPPSSWAPSPSPLSRRLRPGLILGACRIMDWDRLGGHPIGWTQLALTRSEWITSDLRRGRCSAERYIGWTGRMSQGAPNATGVPSSNRRHA